MAAPIKITSIAISKTLETLIKSSWLALLFLIPLLRAYQKTFSAPWLFWVYTGFSVFLMLLTAASVSVTVAIIIARIFSAGQTKKILQVSGGLMIVGLIFLIRALKPEKYIDPKQFASFVNILSDINVPSFEYMPSRWCFESIEAFLTAQPQPFASLGLALFVSLVSFGIMALSARFFYFKAWNRSQEITAQDMAGKNSANLAADFFENTIKGQAGAIISKEMRSFFRNPALWSQSFMIIAVGAIYFYNIYLLPVNAARMISFDIPQILSFLNIAFMGSIISAIAARFIYPAISMEGKAFWILDKSPLKASVLYFSKYIFYALPTLVFAVVLSVISNRILTVPPAMVWVSHINMIMISLLISAQALTMGAIRPDFNEANVAGIPLSAGGLFYMVISLISIIIILALSAYPVIHLIRYNFFFSLLPHKIKIRAALCVCSWLFFCLAGLLISIKTGTKALNRIS
jgi:ABC-2 type transport system permease protein